jgi:hypothetical protein
MGDLQKGERYANIFSCRRCWQLIGSARYANMDFMFLSSVAGSAIKSIIISYDIACQWGHNFFSCMANMPQHLRILESVKIQFKVLKFHLPAHISKCYVPFSFNFAKWVSRTDGEGVERNWSWLNGIARCVSMMGLGGCSDTLDDFCNYHNWRKTVGLGTLYFLEHFLFLNVSLS